MIRHLRLALLCAGLLPLLAAAAPVRMSLKPKAAFGEGLPEVRVHIEEPIAGFELQLTRSDGEKLRVRGGGPPGVTRVITLKQPEGRFGYVGDLRVNFPNASTTRIPLEFHAELWGPLRLTFGEVREGGAAFTFKASRPLRNAHVTVLMDTGRKAFEEAVTFAAEPAGTPLTVEFGEAEGRVLQIKVDATDELEFYVDSVFAPWTHEAPHEEIRFAPRRWDLTAGEKAKLDAVHAELAPVAGRVGKYVSARLYVGVRAEGRRLPVHRARMIAEYLRGRGLRIPVRYGALGPGEAGGAKSRILLSVEPPAKLGPEVRWRSL